MNKNDVYVSLACTCLQPKGTYYELLNIDDLEVLVEALNCLEQSHIKRIPNFKVALLRRTLKDVIEHSIEQTKTFESEVSPE